jgi:uncharacterized protein (DUF58 family)
VSAALLFRIPAVLVMAAPFAFVAVWSTLTRPTDEPTLLSQVSPRTVREGEATTWTAALTGVDEVDHVVAFAPARTWLDLRPPSGVVACGVRSGDLTATLSVAMRATHWGRHDLGPINVVAISAWGAFRWKALDVGYQVTTLPLPEVFDAAPPQHRANGLVGQNRSSRPGDGSEFSGIRPFQTGDRLRRINWRRSLRTGDLHVTSTYSDQDTHVALFVDALADFGPSGGIDGAASSLDTTVRAAGAIAEHFLLRGDRVSLHVFGSRGRSHVPPASGQSHLRRILDVLAMTDPDTSRAGAIRAGRGAIPGDALAIMLSPLISPIALERAVSIASHGLTVAVVDTLPDDVHADEDPATELAWKIRLLERRREVRMVQNVGVPVISWRGPGSLDPFLREIARRAAAPRMARR